jgi:hypothetical protein
MLDVRHGRLAFAFYREGLASNSVYYSFLSFYKIVELLSGPGKKVCAWINSQSKNIRCEENHLNQIMASTNLGDYLWDLGRCAIVHVGLEGGKKIVNPSDEKDFFRLSRDLPIIKELARIAIETKIYERSPNSV